VKRSGPLKRGKPLKRGGSLKRTPIASSRKPITQVSVKTAARNAEYRDIRAMMLDRFPVCYYRFDRICTYTATDIDHVIPRGLAPHRVNDPENMNTACRFCHERRHELPRVERQRLKLGIYADDYVAA